MTRRAKADKRGHLDVLAKLGIGRRRLLKRMSMGIVSASVSTVFTQKAEAACCSCDVGCNTCNGDVCAQRNSCDPNVCNLNSCSDGHSCTGSNNNTCAPVSHFCDNGNSCISNTCRGYNVCGDADGCTTNECDANSCGINTCTEDDWCTLNTCQTSDTDCGYWNISCPLANGCSYTG